VSRDQNFTAPGILVAPGLDAAFAAANGDALRRGTDAIMVAGGAEIYTQAFTQATRLSITEVHKQVEGDARFPAIDRTIWRETSREQHEPQADDETSFAFVSYERVG